MFVLNKISVHGNVPFSPQLKDYGYSPLRSESQEEFERKAKEEALDRKAYSQDLQALFKRNKTLKKDLKSFIGDYSVFEANQAIFREGQRDILKKVFNLFGSRDEIL